ncbi:MAG: serine hydrolase domain-containing protein, partial [Candidatus Latescibacterota bacterium]
MDVYSRMNYTRIRWLAAFVLTIMVAANWTAVSRSETPSNNRQFLPCPGEWLTDAEFYVNHGLLPGLLIMAESPEWGLRVGTAGYADIAASRPPEPAMRYRVGGVTKLMLSTVILQLEQERKLALDNTIDQLLGEGLIPNGYKITLIDCLKMRSGLFDYAQDSLFTSKSKTTDARFLPEEILYKVRQSIAAKSGAPEDAYAYSETGY